MGIVYCCNMLRLSPFKCLGKMPCQELTPFSIFSLNLASVDPPCFMGKLTTFRLGHVLCRKLLYSLPGRVNPIRQSIDFSKHSVSPGMPLQLGLLPHALLSSTCSTTLHLLQTVLVIHCWCSENFCTLTVIAWINYHPFGGSMGILKDCPAGGPAHSTAWPRGWKTSLLVGGGCLPRKMMDE